MQIENIVYVLVFLYGIAIGSFLIVLLYKLPEERITIKHPIVEMANGVAYAFIFVVNGISLQSILYCHIFSIFLIISIIDFKTYEIPVVLNMSIGILAILRMSLEPELIKNHIIGFFVVSGFMMVCLVVSRLAKGIDAFGGGDIKLMAVAGLFMGVKQVVLGFVLGCVFGVIIHGIRMKIYKEENILAFGPYLCAGLFVAIMFGDVIIEWYEEMLM